MLSERADDKTNMNDPSMAVQVNSEEAAEILRACWDTKIIFYSMGGHSMEESSNRHLRTIMNEIASVLGSIAEL